MAYKFQLGAATLSGSLTQEGAGEFDTSLTIGSAVLSEADLENLDDITDGTAAANKALVLDSSRDIVNINRVTAAEIGAFQANGAIDFNNQAMTNVDINSGAIDGVIIGANSAAAGTFAAIVGTTINGTNISGSGYVAATQGQFADLGAEGLNVDNDADVGGALSAGSISGSAALSIGGTIRFDGVAEVAAVATDKLYFMDSDNLMKKDTLSAIRDLGFSVVSGDATIATNGALTIAANAVEGSMLNTDVISGQTALTSGLATTDELLVSDAGTVKRMDVSVLQTLTDGSATALAIALG